MADLTKSEAVLHRLGKSPTFSTSEHDPVAHAFRLLVLPESLIRELGDPLTITLTIEPGDRLHDG